MKFRVTLELCKYDWYHFKKTASPLPPLSIFRVCCYSTVMLFLFLNESGLDNVKEVTVGKSIVVSSTLAYISNWHGFFFPGFGLQWNAAFHAMVFANKTENNMACHFVLLRLKKGIFYFSSAFPTMLLAQTYPDNLCQHCHTILPLNHTWPHPNRSSTVSGPI